MNIFDMLLLTKIIIGLLGLILLVFGIQLLDKSARVIDARIMLFLLSLAYVPNVLFQSILPIIRGELDFINFIFIGMYIFIIIIFKISFGAYTVYNITEEDLYNSIFEFLEESNILYEEVRGKIHLKEFNSQIKISSHAIFMSISYVRYFSSHYYCG